MRERYHLSRGFDRFGVIQGIAYAFRAWSELVVRVWPARDVTARRRGAGPHGEGHGVQLCVTGLLRALRALTNYQPPSTARLLLRIALVYACSREREVLRNSLPTHFLLTLQSPCTLTAYCTA